MSGKPERLRVQTGNAAAKSVLFANDAEDLMRKLSAVYPKKTPFCQMPGVSSIPFMSPGFSLSRSRPQQLSALGITIKLFL